MSDACRCALCWPVWHKVQEPYDSNTATWEQLDKALLEAKKQRDEYHSQVLKLETEKDEDQETIRVLVQALVEATRRNE